MPVPKIPQWVIDEVTRRLCENCKGKACETCDLKEECPKDCQYRD